MRTPLIADLPPPLKPGIFELISGWFFIRPYNALWAAFLTPMPLYNRQFAFTPLFDSNPKIQLNLVGHDSIPSDSLSTLTSFSDLLLLLRWKLPLLSFT